MPPPNFARKKRKSRSRGSSAKRAPRHKSQVSNSLNKNSNKESVKRSSSVDDNSACCSNSTKNPSSSVDAENLPQTSGCAYGVSHPNKIKESSPILSLADEVANAAILTAGKVLKNSSRQINSSNQKGSSTSLIKNSKTLVEKTEPPRPTISRSEVLNSNSVEMKVEEEKLNNLCKLLDRLDTTYGSNSLPASPARLVDEKKKFINSNIHNGAILSPKSSPKFGKTKPSEVNSSQKVQIANKSDEKINTEAISQEEKQAMRKAKKEAKKLGLTQLEDKEQKLPVENLVVPNSHILQSQTSPKELPKTVPATDKAEANEKLKADLKRERREKQEAQRAAKAVAKLKNDAEEKKNEQKRSPIKKDNELSPKKKNIVNKKDVANSLKKKRHLPLLEHLATQREQEVDSMQDILHPAIRAVGHSMRNQTIDGCNARVLATLSAICSLIEDYKTPPSCDLSRDLSDQVSPNIVYLNECRQIPEPMNNAIRFVKKEISELDRSMPEAQAKEILLESIETYIFQNIILASETIIDNAQKFVEDNDFILTFGFSSLVYDTFKKAVKSKGNLSVVIVDNPSSASGANMLPAFSELGISIYYRLLSDLPHIIHKVTKVIIEAEAVVLNGAVMGYCGLAGLILLASSHNVPIIVLSHTYKFCNIDLTDSLVVNELGDSQDIVNCPCPKYNRLLKDWKNSSSLNVVTLVYDVTPAQLVNVLVTERNNFPTSVVPVIIKRNYADILGHD